MIITKTPLRISFAGGGSDLSAYYSQRVGAVLSTTIDKHIYITVNTKFDHLIRASYSQTEMVENVDDIKHELIRESLKHTGISKGIEITSISDIPGQGTGLGSSSSYTVGLVNALRGHLGKVSTPEFLASSACAIEIEKCSQPIGKQDQYAAAFGGLNFIEFHPDGSVQVSPLLVKKEIKQKLQKNMLMFYTGITRSTGSILKEQSNKTAAEKEKQQVLEQMVQRAYLMRQSLEEGNIESFGTLLDENWQLKKQLAGGISSLQIDSWYEAAKKEGALGGKILGAGGGGFLLVYAPEETHDHITSALSELKPVNVGFESEGSKIIYLEESTCD